MELVERRELFDAQRLILGCDDHYGELNVTNQIGSTVLLADLARCIAQSVPLGKFLGREYSRDFPVGPTILSKVLSRTL